MESLEQRQLLSPVAFPFNFPFNAEISLEFTDNDGNAIQQVRIGDSFEIHVYARDWAAHWFDSMAQGVVGAFVDVHYDSNLIDVTGIDHKYTLGASGVIDESAGIVDEVGGGDFGGPATRGRQLVFSLSATAVAPGELTVRTSAGEDPDSVIAIAGIDTDQRRNTSFGQASLTITSRSESESCKYDVDGNGTVSFGDVTLFAREFGKRVADDTERARMDFDGNGVIGFGDAALLAQNFGRARSSGGLQSCAANFPTAGTPNALRTETTSPALRASLVSEQPPLVPETVRELQNAAIDRFEASGLSEAELDVLRSIDIRVLDLPDGYLGLAVDGAIIIDIDASGFGWFIDETPHDDREFETFEQMATGANAAARNRVDLLTVIAHELGHHAGWDHAETGRMSDRLGVGERRTPVTADIDTQFEAFADLDEVLGLTQ
jgi:hypothetical protein